MKELFWKPYVCQENKPSLNMTPSSGTTLDVDDGTVPVCFDAASKKVCHSKCLIYPKYNQKQAERLLSLTKPLVAEGLHLLLLCKVVWRKKNNTAAGYYYYHWKEVRRSFYKCVFMNQGKFTWFVRHATALPLCCSYPTSVSKRRRQLRAFPPTQNSRLQTADLSPGSHPESCLAS